ncbi:MAG: nucleotidyltransferase domain-containing protein [Patescibacteria group bacterium]
MSKKRISGKLKQAIQEYVQLLKNDNLPIQRVVLFGSYAKGLQHPWSDVDICVVSSAFKNSWMATQYLWQKLPRDSQFVLEPVGYTIEDFKNESPLISQIKKTGVRII